MSRAIARKPESLFGALRSIFLMLLLVLVFRSTAVEAFNIPSGSATPTLLTGDYVLVSKFAYGYSRYSLPFAPSFLHGRLFGSDPKRGDYAVFVNPHNGITLIKRIVGLPGDRIQVVHGVLTINGEPSKRERIGEYLEKDWDEPTDSPDQSLRYRYVETMPNGVRHEILGGETDQPEDSGIVDNTPVYHVPAGHYFGMGDSRDNSSDSRYLDRLGYIPAENLIGRADLRFISLEAGAHLWEFWKWPQTLRLNRFFGPIH